MNKKGFTLIEMLIVIAIIAILVAIIVPVVGNSTTKAAAATDAANLRSAKAVLTIAVVNGDLEKNSEGTAVPREYGVTPVAKSEGADIFHYEIDDNGEVTVNFGNGKDITYFADIADNGEEDDTAGSTGTQKHAFVGNQWAQTCESCGQRRNASVHQVN